MSKSVGQAMMDRDRLHKVAGLISLDESQHLYNLASEVPEWASIVEIGSHTGRSTVWLAAGAANGNHAHVTACDPFPNPGVYHNDDPFSLGSGDATLQRFVENVTKEGAWGRITMLRTCSYDLAPTWVNPIGLLFIDGYHDYKNIKRDCEDWLPRVGSGGILALHDWFDNVELTHESEVADALHETWVEDEWEVLSQVQNLWSARRK